MKCLNILLLILLFNNVLIVKSQIISNKTSSTLILTGQGNPILYGKNYKLTKEASQAYLKMKSAAKKEGLNLKIASSHRAFDRQVAIWNYKYSKNMEASMTPEENIKKITEYSTIPGTSRHHWGTEIDLIDAVPKVEGDVLLTTLFEENGPYASLNNWLKKNAHKYNFYLVYTNEESRTGFKYEPWHYSYVPQSKRFLKEFLDINIKELINSKKILGKEYLSEDFIEKYINEYVLGVSKKVIE